MPNLEDIIEGHIFGDAFVVRKQITEIPNGIILMKAWFSIRVASGLNNFDTTDENVQLQKEITDAPTLAGLITDTGTGSEPNRIGEVLFKVATGETLVLSEGTPYTWDIQLLLNNDDVATPFKGQFIGQYGVTVRSA